MVEDKMNRFNRKRYLKQLLYRIEEFKQFIGGTPLKNALDYSIYEFFRLNKQYHYHLKRFIKNSQKIVIN